MRDTVEHIIRLSHENIIIEFFAASIIFFLFLFLRKIFTNVVFKFLQKVTSKTSFIMDKYILVCFEKPVRFLFVVLGLYASASMVADRLDYQLIVDKAFRSLLVYTFAWGFYNISNSSSEFFKKVFEQYDIEDDKIL